MSKDTVKTVVLKHLTDNMLDGLYNPNFECACEVKDLMPCEHEKSECVPGIILEENKERFMIGFMIGDRNE